MDESLYININKYFRKILDTIVLVSLAWVFVYGFLSIYTVTGNGMEETLHSGDVVLVNKFSYGVSNPERFDVVIFNRSKKIQNIKRIVGLPSESLVIQNGNIYINGALLENDIFSIINIASLAKKPVELYDDEYFLLGDNTDSSEDSRFSNIGNISRGSIVGKAWFIIYPFSRIGFIK